LRADVRQPKIHRNRQGIAFAIRHRGGKENNAGQLRKLHHRMRGVAFNTAALKLFDTVRNVAGVLPVGLVDPLRSKVS
jgi:hypothetical protein